MTLLTEGDVFDIVSGDRVYASLPRHMAPLNYSFGLNLDVVGDWTICHAEVTAGEKLSNGCNAGFLIGKYIVTKTETTGGGTGMGPHDVFSDGHKVTAQHAEHPNVIVSFFQTGAFTCMLRDKVATGRATATWRIENLTA